VLANRLWMAAKMRSVVIDRETVSRGDDG
jgi:hypothetical protein